MARLFKGGRGKKAPYSTTVIRVPTPLIKDVELMIEVYQERLSNVSQTNNINHLSPDCDLDRNLPCLAQALIFASQVKRQKKGAIVSLVKLLQLLYNDKTISKEDIK